MEMFYIRAIEYSDQESYIGSWVPVCTTEE